LTCYAPSDPRWQDVSQEVAHQLVRAPAYTLRQWTDNLRPLKRILTGPLGEVFRDPEYPALERSKALEVLIQYAADQPEVLVGLLQDAEPLHFGVVFEAARGTDALPLLRSAVSESIPSDGAEQTKERAARRKGNAAVALLKLSDASKVWPLLELAPDPRLRSYLIHGFRPLGVSPAILADRLVNEQESTIRRALILALGTYLPEEVAVTPREKLIATLRDWYQKDADAGLHAAAEWTLRQWKQQDTFCQIDAELATSDQGPDKDNGQPSRGWYINTQGQTMVILKADSFLMGSPETEADREADEVLHQRKIGRSLAIASKEVTREQFSRLELRPLAGDIDQFAPTGDSPQLYVTWYMAAAYCNWLSDQEGIPKDQWCYLPNEEHAYAEGMRVAPDFPRRRGYRLPTEAEWEFACRAGTATARYYGESDELLSEYAQYSSGGARPVAVGKPNDFGLFDMYGNVAEWCQERYAGYTGNTTAESADDAMVRNADLRGSRGGGFNTRARSLRSASRDPLRVTTLARNRGFRVARTCAVNTDFDLFDMDGNMAKWRQEHRAKNGKDLLTRAKVGTVVTDADLRSSRSEAFGVQAQRLRLADRGTRQVTIMTRGQGFRVARTCHVSVRTHAQLLSKR
jgi:formylglycine-generating enzyme required for sulfatase activity